MRQLVAALVIILVATSCGSDNTSDAATDADASEEVATDANRAANDAQAPAEDADESNEAAAKSEAATDADSAEAAADDEVLAAGEQSAAVEEASTQDEASEGEAIDAQSVLDDIGVSRPDLADVPTGELLDLAVRDGAGTEALSARFVYQSPLANTNGCDAAFYAFDNGFLNPDLTRSVFVNSCRRTASDVRITDPLGNVVAEQPELGTIIIPWNAMTGVYTAAIETEDRTLTIPFVVRPLNRQLLRVTVDGTLHLAIVGQESQTVTLEIIDVDEPNQIAGVLQVVPESDLELRPISSDRARCISDEYETVCFPSNSGEGSVCRVPATSFRVGQSIALRVELLQHGAEPPASVDPVVYDSPGTYAPVARWSSTDGATGTAQCPSIVVAATACAAGEFEWFDSSGTSQCEPQVTVSCSVSPSASDADSPVTVSISAMPPNIPVAVGVSDGDGKPAQFGTVLGEADFVTSYLFPGDFTPRMTWRTMAQTGWGTDCGTVGVTGYGDAFQPCADTDRAAPDVFYNAFGGGPIFRTFPDAATEQSSLTASNLGVVDCLQAADGTIWWLLQVESVQRWATRSDVESLRLAGQSFNFTCSLTPGLASAGESLSLQVESLDGIVGLIGSLDLDDGTTRWIPEAPGSVVVAQVAFLDPGRFEPTFVLSNPFQADIACGEVTIGELSSAFVPCADGESPSATELYRVDPDLNDTLNERSGPSTDFDVIGELEPGVQHGYFDCRRSATNPGARWWRRVGGGWASARFLEQVDTGRAEPDAAAAPPVKVSAQTIFENGSAICVQGIADDDTLNVRISSSLDAEIIGELRPNSCGIRTLGGQEDGWLRIAAFAAADEPIVLDGWAYSTYLVPASQVDSAEAAAMSEGFVPLTPPNAGNPVQAYPCVETNPGQVRCGVSNWTWEPATSPCNDTGVDRWKITDQGDLLLERVDGRWVVIDRRILAINC